MSMDAFGALLRTETRRDLLTEIVGFAQRLGFDTVSATVVADHVDAETEFIIVDNTPAAYREHFESVDNGSRDPVGQYCKRHHVPIVWNQDTYTSAGQGAKWETQARHGYRCGIAFALHLPEGRHFMLGVDRDQALPKSEVEIRRMAADLCLFTVHAQ